MLLKEAVKMVGSVLKVYGMCHSDLDIRIDESQISTICWCIMADIPKARINNLNAKNFSVTVENTL